MFVFQVAQKSREQAKNPMLSQVPVKVKFSDNEVFVQSLCGKRIESLIGNDKDHKIEPLVLRKYNDILVSINKQVKRGDLKKEIENMIGKLKDNLTLESTNNTVQFAREKSGYSLNFKDSDLVEYAVLFSFGSKDSLSVKQAGLARDILK